MMPILALLAAVGATSAHAKHQLLIPPPFRGDWDESAKGCEEGDWSSHLKLKSRTIEPYESEGQLRSLRILDQNSIAIVAHYRWADGSEVASERFILSPDRQHLTWLTGGERHRLIRCRPKPL